MKTTEKEQAAARVKQLAEELEQAVVQAKGLGLKVDIEMPNTSKWQPLKPTPMSVSVTEEISY